MKLIISFRSSWVRGKSRLLGSNFQVSAMLSKIAEAAEPDSAKPQYALHSILACSLSFTFDLFGLVDGVWC